MTLTKILSEPEIAQLISFNKNEALKEAVKKVLFHSIHTQGTLSPDEPVEKGLHWIYGLDPQNKLTNEEVATKLKVIFSAESFIEEAWNKISTFQEEVEQKSGDNPAL